jgi:hypothetical protein
MNPRMVLFVASVALVCGLPGQAVAAPATGKPVHVQCGQIIRTDTVVGNDLHGCTNIGLSIGAPNITLDLNGHTIEGNGTPLADCPEEEPCNVGITNAEIDGSEVVNGPGFAGVTIRNGTVRGFAAVGIYEFGVNNNRISTMNVNVEPGDDGVILTRSSASRVDHVTVTGFQFVGFVASHSHDIAVVDSSASNAPGDLRLPVQ